MDENAAVAERQWTTGLLRRAGTKLGNAGLGTPHGISPQQRVELRVTAVEVSEAGLREGERLLDDRVATLEAAVMTLCGLLAESGELLTEMLAGDVERERVRIYLAYLQERVIDVGVAL